MGIEENIEENGILEVKIGKMLYFSVLHNFLYKKLVIMTYIFFEIELDRNCSNDEITLMQYFEKNVGRQLSEFFRIKKERGILITIPLFSFFLCYIVSGTVLVLHLPLF